MLLGMLLGMLPRLGMLLGPGNRGVESSREAGAGESGGHSRNQGADVSADQAPGLGTSEPSKAGMEAGGEGERPKRRRKWSGGAF